MGRPSRGDEQELDGKIQLEARESLMKFRVLEHEIKESKKSSRLGQRDQKGDVERRCPANNVAPRLDVEGAL